MDNNELVEAIIECAKTVRGHFTPCYEENVYKNALFIELTEAGHSVETEVRFDVLTATGLDDGILINFGSERIQIRHRTRLYRPKAIIENL